MLSGNPLSWLAVFGPGAVIASLTIGTGGIDLLFPRRGAVWLPHSVFVCDDLAVEVGGCSRIVPAHGSHWCASVSANARIARSSWMGLALVVSAVYPCDRCLGWFLKNTGNNVLFFLLNLLRLTNIY